MHTPHIITLRTAALGLASAAMLCLSAVGGSAAANGLRDHAAINNGLAIIAAADMIRNNCDAISPRILNAYGFARSLQLQARQAGFTDRDIDIYVKNKTEKARIEAMARAYLAANGVDFGVPETYCTVGRYEIDRNSQIGVLLKAK